MFLWFYIARNEWVLIYLIKTVLKKTSNCMFNMELTWRNCNWTGKLQATRFYFLKEIVLAHFQRLFGRSNRDVFLENEGKVYAEATTRGALGKKGVLRNFVKFTGKHQCQGLFFNKVTGLQPATLLKMKFWHRRFPVNFAKFLRTPFFTEHLLWLLLKDAGPFLTFFFRCFSRNFAIHLFLFINN